MRHGSIILTAFVTSLAGTCYAQVESYVAPREPRPLESAPNATAPSRPVPAVVQPVSAPLKQAAEPIPPMPSEAPVEKETAPVAEAQKPVPAPKRDFSRAAAKREAEENASKQEQNRRASLLKMVGEKNFSLVLEAEKYLTGLTTLVADFTQVAPDGSLASGKFFLKRPGKMRWQYDPPTPVLMVTSGMFLTYYDYELEQVSNIPLDSTLTAIIARDVVKFDDSLNVKASHEPGRLRITLTKLDAPDEGSLTLEFEDKPLILRNMEITDAQKQTTHISLNNAQFGVKLEDKLFIFEDPRRKRRH